MNRVGIFGGAFNPIHYGHLFIANEAFSKFRLEKVIFVPTGNPVFPKEDLLPGSIRLEFVKLSVKNVSYFEVSDFEVIHKEPSYFIKTLLHLLEQERCEECFTIIGEDAFLHFHKWKEPMEILKHTNLIVAKRFEGNFYETKRYTDTFFKDFKKKIFYLNHPLYPVSSTLIRKRIKNGEPISYLLPETIEKEIIKNAYFG